MKSSALLLLSLVCLTGISTAQITTNTAPEEGYIEVTGMAERKIVPDEIYITLSLKKRQKGRETLTIKQQEADLKQALAAKGIDLKNLTVSDAQGDYVRVKWTKWDVVAQRTYELKVANAKEVAQAFEVFDELDIEGADIARVDHSQLKELQKEVEVEAILNAKEKADYLLKALGQQTGKPIAVRDSKTREPIGLASTAGGISIAGYGVSSKDKYVMDDLLFRKITLSSYIFVRFVIE